MLVIVNDLLDLHKIEAGKVELEAVPFDLRPVLEELLEVVAPTAFSKGIELACFIPPPLEGERCPRLVGDPCRLKQIIMNLAYNGIKFTRKGHVIVACEVLPAGPETALVRVYTRLHIDVTDTGLGIDPAGIDRIWQDYVQADQSVTRLYGGTGMGLPISKRLAELMGGTISVESAPGVGSTFVVEVPLRLIGECWEEEKKAEEGKERMEEEVEVTPGPAAARLEDAPSLATLPPRRHMNDPAPLYPPRLALPAALAAYPPLWIVHPDPEISAILLEYARSAGWPRPASAARRPDEPPPDVEPAAQRPPLALLVLDESVQCRPAADAAASAAAALVCLEAPLPRSERAHRRRLADRRPSACECATEAPGPLECAVAAPAALPAAAAVAGPALVAELSLAKPVRYHKFVTTLQRALEALAQAAAAAEAEAARPEAEAEAAAGTAAGPGPKLEAAAAGTAVVGRRVRRRRSSKCGRTLGEGAHRERAAGAPPEPAALGEPTPPEFPAASPEPAPAPPPPPPAPTEASAPPEAPAPPPSPGPPPARATPEPSPSPPNPQGAAAAPSAPSAAPAEQPQQQQQQPGILVVDDVDLNRKVCVSLLRKGGLASDQAAHGGEAVDRVRARCDTTLIPPAARGECPYRVIFMDVEMPVLNGTGATREIRRLEAEGKTGGPPSAIVALTANVTEEALQRCLGSGMDGLLAKPVRKDEVLGTVEKYSAWRRPEPGAPAPAPRP
eukprot:tig00000076_g2310.t1